MAKTLKFRGKYEELGPSVRSNKSWYKHGPYNQLSCDVNIQCDHIIEASGNEKMVINSQERDIYLIKDIAIPGDVRVHSKEVKKMKKSRAGGNCEKCTLCLRLLRN